MSLPSDRADARDALAALVADAIASGSARYLRVPDPGRARAPSPNSATCRNATLRGVSSKLTRPKMFRMTTGNRLVPVSTYKNWSDK
jgi:hypothetical protein